MSFEWSAKTREDAEKALESGRDGYWWWWLRRRGQFGRTRLDTSRLSVGWKKWPLADWLRGGDVEEGSRLGPLVRWRWWSWWLLMMMSSGEERKHGATSRGTRRLREVDGWAESWPFSRLGCRQSVSGCAGGVGSRCKVQGWLGGGWESGAAATGGKSQVSGPSRVQRAACEG